MAFRDPLGTVADPGPVRPGAVVASALAGLLAPAEREVEPPAWLRAGQRASLRLTMAALERYGVACLADPVGSGKTYVALAAAAVLGPGRPTVCLVPAALRTQWERAAASVGVPVVVWSHERVSRGALPPPPSARRGLVIVDESHRFRDPAARRYRTVAPWLCGRPLLLLSATPIVNRPDDLAHQLRLGARDDVLRAAGVPSLGSALREGSLHPALTRLVVTGTPPGGDAMPARTATTVVWPASATLRSLLAAVDRLRLAGTAPLATLIRGVLWRAAASSPAALAGALRRYHALLAHARDAAAAGRSPTRADVLRATLGAWDQLVLWELLPDAAGAADLVLDDLEPLDRLARRALAACRRPDPKAEHLAALVGDGRPTLVFTWARETVRHLCTALGPATAWVTGVRAGIGSTTLPRDAVLAWLAPGARRALPRGLRAPSVVVATEVAAEGLDLQGAGRVVHYDLPWTPTRLEQREGRAARLGATHAVVEVATFVPPPPIERRVGQSAAISRKATLPVRAALGADGARLRRVVRTIAGGAPAAAGPMPSGGIAACDAAPRGLLLGYALGEGASGVVWLDADGGVMEDMATIAARLEAATAATDLPLEQRTRRRAVARAARFLSSRLRAVLAAEWAVPDPSPAARALMARLRALARAAARARDARRLALADGALRFASRPHTAGEAAVVARLAELPAAELERELAALPEAAPSTATTPSTLWPRVIGVVVFRGG